MRITNNLTLAVTLLLVGFSQNTYATDGLHNSGFEKGLTDWTISATDQAVAVGSEGPADSTTYADENITVDPYIGAKMLRLGTPKNVNEQQNSGNNTATQTFTATGETLQFSFRIFSWEHRGDDRLTIDLRDAAGNTFPIAIDSGSISPLKMCRSNSTPCDITIDVGKRGTFVNTDWVVATISGLTPTTSYTIEYTLAAEQNEALGSWAYFDNVNNPPVARFNFSPNYPGNVDPSPLESDSIQFADGSYDPDEPNDEIVAWEWTITGPDIPTQVINVQNPIFQFPNDGSDYNVTLKVTDKFDATDTVSTGEFASDGTSVPELIIYDAKARLNALNIEAIVDKEFTLFARFFDPGAPDIHTATWNLGGSTPIDGNLIEEHEPMLSSGAIQDSYTFDSVPSDCIAITDELYCELSASITLTDSASGTIVTDDFTIRIYSEIDTREDNDDIDLVALESGWSYLSNIGTPGDKDIFEVILPDNKPLTAGSEIFISLSNLPADLELVVLSTSENTTQNNNYQTAPYNILPYNILPYNILPYNILPYNILPYNILPYNILPYNILPYNILPYNILPYNILPYNILPYNILSPYDDFGFFGVPLSHLGFTPSFQENLTGTDIDLAELGLDVLLNSGLRVVNHSVNRGFEDESLLIRVATSNTRYFIAVVGNNGVFSLDPYTLQIETSVPIEREILLGDLCVGTPLVSNSTNRADVVYGNNTLIVTQQDRMQAIYPDQWEAMYNNLDNFAKDNKATIISLPSSIYNDWDTRPCNVDEANLVAESIQQIIMSYPDAEYVVLVGSDNIIPSARIPDETTLSNERMYSQSAFLKPQSPLAASIAEGYILTDDFYVDPTPVIWQGRELYLPKRSIGRLVESPSEISTTLLAYKSSGGQINDPMIDATAMVSGYDFFTDGATLSLTFLDNSFDTDPINNLLISDSWNADDLRCNLLGEDNSNILNCIIHDISNFNAHMTHFAALSANGFKSSDVFASSFSELVTGFDVATAGANNSGLSSKLIYTIGCHAGMNVPDNDALSPDFFGLLSDPRLDFAQAMARQGSVYVASTGYGIGDDAGIAGTEGLMAFYSQELAKGGSVGNALMQAKLNYYGQLLSPTAYDEKSLIQTVMYGLPMYQVNVSADNPGSGITDVTPGEINLNYTPELLTIPDTGSYYTVNGLAQSTAGRPLQPKEVLNIVLGSNEQANGVLILGGHFSDEVGFDPVISRPVIEWETNVSEPQICLNAFWPSVISEINTIEFPKSIQQKLVMSYGQFRCTTRDNKGNSIGVQRLFTSLKLNLLSSTNNSGVQQGPRIQAVDINKDRNENVKVTVHTNDDIEQIVIAIFDPNEPVDNISSQSLKSLTGTSLGSYSIDLGPLGDDVKLFTQVANADGFVSTWTGKGANVRAIVVDAGPDLVFSSVAPTTLTGKIENFTTLLEEADDITYVWDFADESFMSDPLAINGVPVEPFVSIDNNGTATFSVTHSYTLERDIRPSLKITGGFGGIGTDDLLLRHCGDPVDLSPEYANLDYVACSTDNLGSKVTIYLSVNAVITNDMQFRLFIDHSGSRNNPDPDNKPDELLKYKGGVSTGMKSLIVEQISDTTLKFEFDLSEAKFKGTYIQWYAETQDGVAGEQSTGHADVMPDTGFYTYTLH